MPRGERPTNTIVGCSYSGLRQHHGALRRAHPDLGRIHIPVREFHGERPANERETRLHDDVHLGCLEITDRNGELARPVPDLRENRCGRGRHHRRRRWSWRRRRWQCFHRKDTGEPDRLGRRVPRCQRVDPAREDVCGQETEAPAAREPTRDHRRNDGRRWHALPTRSAGHATRACRDAAATRRCSLMGRSPAPTRRARARAALPGRARGRVCGRTCCARLGATSVAPTSSRAAAFRSPMRFRAAGPTDPDSPCGRASITPRNVSESLDGRVLRP